MSAIPDQIKDGEAVKEILVVASKLKKYIKEAGGMSTSAGAMAVISDFIRAHCDDAIENAKNDGRKTVLDRDFVKKIENSL